MRNLVKLNDEELIVLLNNSDIAAFEEIFLRYWEKLYDSAYKRVKSHESAEEIVQELFTQLWMRRRTIQIHTSLAAYLFTSAKYMVLNHIQKESLRENYKDSLLIATMPYDNVTEDTILVNDLNRNIQLKVNNLPPKCRSVFELSRRENKTNREIAEQLGISEKTVEGHLTRAIRLIKVSLSDISRLASWFF